MKVKAVINVDVGGPLIIDDLDIGDPGPTHVIVKQFATGVCHSQLHQMHNPALPRPLVLGHESTGVVLARGREVTHVSEGDRVMLTWVQRDRFEHTPDPTPWRATHQGKQVRHGDRSPTGVFTWAETIIADQQYVVKLTEPDVPTDVTSIVGCAVMTGCGAVVNSALYARPVGSRDRRWRRRPLCHPGGVQPGGAPDYRGRPQRREDRVRDKVRRQHRSSMRRGRMPWRVFWR